MRRAALVYAVTWLVLFGSGYLLWSLAHESGPSPAVRAAMYATLWSCYPLLLQALRRRRRPDTAERTLGMWRVLEPLGWSRWRPGWLHLSSGVLVGTATVGKGELRLPVEQVSSVTARPPGRAERWRVARGTTVLEVMLADGTRADLAVERAALADVRRWLAAAEAPEPQGQ
jgi:hypothetical protein